MGPVLDLKGRQETTMKASTSKDHLTFVQMQKDKNIRSSLDCKNKDVELDILNSTTDDEGHFGQSQSDDATATSSSFDDPFSAFGNHPFEGDEEVMSELRVSSDLFPARKKRVTSDWRKFIRPIMWRCKWLELQIKKFQTQAIKYDKEIEKDYQRKQLKYKNFELEGHCAKMMPFIQDSKREKPFRRKKRKRDEVDTKLYMSQHNVFSYYATKKSTTNGGVKIDEDQTNPVATTSTDKNVGNEFRVPNELLSLDFRDEFSLEQLLWRIEVAQTRVSEMTTRLDTVITENAERIPPIEEDITLQESNNMSPHGVNASNIPTNRDVPSAVASFASELMKFNTDDDLVKLENEGLNHEKETNLEIVNIPTEEPPVVASRKRSTDGILIYNRRSKKAQSDSGAVKIHPIEKIEEEKSKKTDLPSVSGNSSSQNEEPAPKLRSVSKITAPRNKKKRAVRAKRKSASNLWTRRNST